ncbi:MAG: MogA/MoaB family molybdenum cofactor biosynthesis protein [Solirubrobacteraceae bacterium]
MRAAVLTLSTSVAARAREDSSGVLLAELAEAAGWEIAAMEVIADDAPLIEDRLRNYVEQEIELILTTGGTGLTPDDVTPEATAAVIDRAIPGIGEALRAASLAHTPHGMLSREQAGVAGRTLIVNLPGSPRAVRQLWAVLEPVLVHAVATIRGDGRH